jgi:hypothetical protein
MSFASARTGRSSDSRITPPPHPSRVRACLEHTTLGLAIETCLPRRGLERDRTALLIDTPDRRSQRENMTPAHPGLDFVRTHCVPLRRRTMTKATKKPTPNKLAKTGKKSGVALTEKQLDQASGGVANKYDIKY